MKHFVIALNENGLVLDRVEIDDMKDYLQTEKLLKAKYGAVKCHPVSAVKFPNVVHLKPGQILTLKPVMEIP